MRDSRLAPADALERLAEAQNQAQVYAGNVTRRARAARLTAAPSFLGRRQVRSTGTLDGAHGGVQAVSYKASRASTGITQAHVRA